MAGGGPGGAVDAEVGDQLVEVAQTGGDEDRIAALALFLERVGAVHRYADLRVGRRERLGHARYVLEVIVLAVERERLLRPGAPEDLHDLGEALAAFGVGDAVRLIGARKTAA